MQSFSKNHEGLKLDIRGIIPPMVTPFTSDSEAIDTDLARQEVDVLLKAPINGICVAGSTGEGQGMSEDDLNTICKAVVDQVNDSVQVIGGVIADSTIEGIRKGLAAKEAGVTSLQVTPPHYLWSPSVEGLIQHYSRIGEATRLPILIYNVIPWVDIDVYAMDRIIDEVPWVLGVKQSGGDMHKIADMMEKIHPKVPITTGIDDLLYSNFALGVDGAVSCMTAVFPNETHELQQFVLNNDHPSALQLHKRLLPVWRTLEGTNMTAKAKFALSLLGRPTGISRSPILAPNEKEKTAIEQALKASKFL